MPNTYELLKVLLANRSSKNQLIQLVLPKSSEQSVMLRYCAAVQEYVLLKDKTEKKQKGLKIICTFIEKGSLFNLTNIPLELEKDLCQKRSLDALGVLQDFLLKELSQSPIVREVVAQVSSEFPVVSTKPPPAAVDASPSKRPLLKVQIWSNEFYDTVISPVLSPVFGNRDSVTVGKIQLNDETMDFERVLENKLWRHRLIMKLVSVDPQMSVCVRLCCAILEYKHISENKFPVEKTAKARKIVAVFVNSGSLFCVRDLPVHITSGLIEEENFKLLEELREYLDVQLLNNDCVRSEVTAILSNVE